MSHEVDILPEILNAGDPCGGDEAKFVPTNGKNYAEYAAGPLVGGALVQAERAFHDDAQRWLAGELAYEALLPHVKRLVLEAGERFDKRPLLPAPVELPDELLADIVEDEVPDAGVLLERITGDPLAPPTVGTMAALAWLESLGDNRRAIDAWADQERDRRLISAFNRIDRAPPCLYVDGVIQIPINPKMVPPGGPAGVYVARAYRTEAGWAFSTKVDLPRCPAIGPLRRRLQVELWRLRVKERRATWEDVMRQRPAVIYRACAEGARDAGGRAGQGG